MRSSMAFRAFISVDVGDRIDWHGLRRELTDVDQGVRVVRPEHLHLTLRFLGDTDEGTVDGITRVMDSAVRGVAPFPLHFEHVGAFPNPRKARVVWIGLRGAEPLGEMSHVIERGVVDLGFAPENRPFRPHATVARIKHLRRSERLASLLERWSDRSFGVMEVRSLELKRSQLTPRGPIYSTVHSTTLEG
jgi:2'-5' RNA ligase